MIREKVDSVYWLWIIAVGWTWDWFWFAFFAAWTFAPSLWMYHSGIKELEQLAKLRYVFDSNLTRIDAIISIMFIGIFLYFNQ